MERNIGRLLKLSLIFVASAQTLYADNQPIVVVKSSDNSYFNQTIETLINRAGDHARFKVINTSKLDSASDILKNARVVITLGGHSARKISSQLSSQLVINAYITLEQTRQFQYPKQKSVAVLLNQPLERNLAFCHYLLNLNTLGIINRAEPRLNNRQQQTLKKLNLRLNQYPLGNTNKNLLTTVRQLSRENGALLMLPDQSIYNRNTLKGILLTTYRSRTPVISYSPGHVKSGALAAIYSSPDDIGRHLASLINQHHNGRLNSSNKAINAKYYSIAINQRVAHSLGLDLPGEEKLRQLIDEATR